MKKTIGLYVHIPFCKTKCIYCNFFSTVNYKKEDFNKYICYLLKEFLIRREECNEIIDTIYIGGGSPSILETETLKLFFDKLSKIIDYKNIIETTIEVNPSDVSDNLINFISTLPNSRISVGIQTLNEKILSFINRKTELKIINNCFNIIEKSQIKNVSIDFIVGLPYADKYQTANDIEKSLEVLKKTNHISMYYLEFEDNEYLKNKFKNLLLTDDELIESYDIAANLLKQKEFERYEISSFTKNHNYSKHNMHYWNLDDYIGIGLSASGCYKSRRYKNTHYLKNYFMSLEDNKISENNFNVFDVIDNNKKEKEFIFLSLRMKNGINLKTYKTIFKIDFTDKYKNIIESNKSYFVIDNKKVCISEKYINYTDEISILFF